MFFIARRRKKSRGKRILLKRGKKRVFSVPLRRRVLSSLLRSLSLSRLLVCAPLSFSLSLSLCLFFFRASKNLSFFLWFFGFFFGCFFNGWVFARTEKEKKFWIGHLHTTSQILLSPPFVYLFTEHTALLCTPHHQRQDARLLLKSLL